MYTTAPKIAITASIARIIPLPVFCMTILLLSGAGVEFWFVDTASSTSAVAFAPPSITGQTLCSLRSGSEYGSSSGTNGG